MAGRRIGRALSGKPTRITLDRFVAAHATPALTLAPGLDRGRIPFFHYSGGAIRPLSK